jgi:hypothetical protein
MPFETDGMVDAAIVINASTTNNKVTFFIKYFVLVVNEFSLGESEPQFILGCYTTLEKIYIIHTKFDVTTLKLKAEMCE